MEIQTNYQRMLIQCLKEEIRAFLNYSDKPKAVELQEMATSWLFDDDYNANGEFSCGRICKVLSQPIETLRINIAFARNKGWSLDEYMNYSLYGEKPKEVENEGE